MSKKDPKKEMDPEEIMRRKFKAKCNFKALGRLCMANAYWLIEDIDHYEGVEDVKRRVEQAVRTKAKKQLLSVRDKALLNKPTGDRTESEKKYLYRIIGGLKCFKRYPNHVKRKLAALTYFKYYGPDRVIVRQHQQAHAMYFIVSGEVIVSQMIFDELLEEYQSVDIGTMSAGDMFGEVSLLHNIPRTATVTTADHCEFLMLLAEDFENVLLTSVQKQWDQVRAAMSMFTYFEQLDEVSSREGCIVARLKNYKENEIIFGDGCEIPNHVYFILSGRVQMIETLRIIVVKILDKTFYTLYDPYVTPEVSEESFETKFYQAYPDLKSRISLAVSKLGMTSAEISKMEAKSAEIEASASKQRVRTSDDVDVINLPPEEGQESQDPHSKTAVGTEVKSEDIKEVKPPTSATQISTQDVGVETKRASFQDPLTALEKTEKISVHEQPPLSTIPEQKSQDFSQGSQIYFSPNVETGDRESINPLSTCAVPPLPADVISGKGKLQTFFMQVCQMNPGSTFGFGENMRDRRMVAITDVQCMLIPKVWLLQRNTANIWTRIQYYLEKKIPPKKKVFEEFVKQRQWLEYRDQCINDAVARSNTVNYTTLHDVPYAIRLEEMYDI